jgi:hypothetical protein
MPSPHRAHNVEDDALFQIERLHDSKNEVGAALAKADISRGVVVHFAQAARIEKPKDGGLRGKIEHARRLGTGTKAATDLCIAGLGQLADDGGFAALHLAKQPNHGGETPRPFCDWLLGIGGGGHGGAQPWPSIDDGWPAGPGSTSNGQQSKGGVL